MAVYPIDRHGDGQRRRCRTQPPRPAHPQRALTPGSGARQNTLLKPRPRFGASIIGQGGIKQLSCEEVAAVSIDVFLLVHVHSLALVLAVRGNRPSFHGARFAPLPRCRSTKAASFSRSVCRARQRRSRTEPPGMPSNSAISGDDSSYTVERTKASGRSRGNALISCSRRAVISRLPPISSAPG